MIGSLGVLDDVTVTQVSAVWETAPQPGPTPGGGPLFTRALKIGRDPISSTVNTLFLAYAGAALPLLLLFTGVGESITARRDSRDRGDGDRARPLRLDRSRRIRADQHVAGRPGRDEPTAVK